MCTCHFGSFLRCHSILITTHSIRNFAIHFLFIFSVFFVSHFQLRIDTLRITRIDWARFFNSKLVIVPMLIKFSSAFIQTHRTITDTYSNLPFERSIKVHHLSERKCGISNVWATIKRILYNRSLAKNMNGAMNEADLRSMYTSIDLV